MRLKRGLFKRQTISRLMLKGAPALLPVQETLVLLGGTFPAHSKSPKARRLRRRFSTTGRSAGAPFSFGQARWQKDRFSAAFGISSWALNGWGGVQPCGLFSSLL